MDPEFYRNSLQSRYAPEISSLLSEQAGLTQGLTLGASFPGASPLASAAARSFGPLPGYTGHALHSNLPEAHLQNITSQNTYKSLQVSQAALGDPYAGLRLTSQPGSLSHVTSKPLFTQDPVLQKDITFPSMFQPSTGLDLPQKSSWGLSNYGSQAPSAYGHPADLSTGDYSLSHSLVSSQPSLLPPPAHSSKPATPILRHHPYAGSDMYSTRSTKSPQTHNVFDHRSHTATPVSSQASVYSFSQSSYPSKSDVSIYSSSDNITYEAVSPAPEQHSQQNESYVSLEDLASISSTQQKLDVNRQHLTKPSPVIPERPNKAHGLHKKTLSQQDMYNGQSTPLSQVKQSPQPSPISVGGSPHMQIGSPQAPVPSSTVVQAPPPVQAPADSTTKPKRSRGRKKKEAINDLKSDSIRQNYSPQAFTSSPEVSQHRVLGSEYMNSQQGYMQSNRTNQQAYTSANLSDTGHSSSPLIASTLNQPYAKSQTPSDLGSHSSNPSAHSQAPQMMGYQVSTTASQSGLSYSVSDALEMSREAVFTNQGLLEGYNNSDMSGYNMQETFTGQLGMDNNMRRNDMYSSQEEQPMYVNHPYGGQYVSPNSVLNMEMGNAQNTNQQSTIDEAAFSSLMGESFNQDQNKGQGYIPLTVKIEAEQDEDLSHLAQAPLDSQNESTAEKINKFFSSAQFEHPVPPANPKPTVKNASGGTSFMDSFMSFLQGKKPETLSSMSSAIIQNKPQLPKYIPEPRRPRPVDFSDSANCDALSDEFGGSTDNGSMISFCDQDNVGDPFSSDGTQGTVIGNNNDKVQISTNKSGGLTMKINLTKVKKAEEQARKMKKKYPKKKDRGKNYGLKNSGQEGHGSGEKSKQDPAPSRHQSTRRAKEVRGRYKESDDSDSDTLKPIVMPGQEDIEQYDSDNDPAWTPLALDKKPGFDVIEAAAKKRGRPRSKGQKNMEYTASYLDQNSLKTSDVSQELLRLNKEDNPYYKMSKYGEPEESSEDETLMGIPPITDDLKVGDFVMEKKDRKNTESYAIWKIESGRMLHKFELFCDNSRILHRAIPTFSSWLPNMKNGFIHIQVEQVYKHGDKEYVEVHEEYRPRPRIDSKLEEKYEEHPLVDAFNVYLQIFLSQALEPGFLSAIRQANERFYLDAMEKIDNAINFQLADIDSRVRWKSKFKECLKTRPHIRELDRPNLKQSCQACEFASQPAIKSVHLFGNPYDRFTLADHVQLSHKASSQEFLIGKHASKFAKPFHHLYHFKYNLFKRCVAKVNIIHDSNVNDNAAVLDHCLQNRAWVLQIFQDLKKLLEKG